MGDGEEASGGGSRKKGRQNTNALFLVSTKTGEVRSQFCFCVAAQEAVFKEASVLSETSGRT
jgi:hypothetical protein